MEAKQISVSRNHTSIRISGIIAVGALFWIDAEDRIGWNLRGRAAGEAVIIVDCYHCIILFGHLLSFKPYFFTSSITMTQSNCSSLSKWLISLIRSQNHWVTGFSSSTGVNATQENGSRKLHISHILGSRTPGYFFSVYR